MPLLAGFTRFHDCILNVAEADEFKRLERRLRRQIDNRRPVEAQCVLTEIKQFARDLEIYRQLFETIRRDADARWKAKWGRPWQDDMAQMAEPRTP